MKTAYEIIGRYLGYCHLRAGVLHAFFRDTDASRNAETELRNASQYVVLRSGTQVSIIQGAA